MYLKLEGLDPRAATNREEIVAAIRQVPLPDLVLLDYGLPDANGFEVLAKLRQHPVLKGIQGGADGYVTKPFQIHPLIRAVKEVLCLACDASDPEWDFSH